jgi:dTDP-4-dehydrorhamnose 3,5-epimerase
VIFREQTIGGVYELLLEPAEDERGFFARTYARDEFAEQGIAFTVEQASVSYNARRGTLRGLHLQLPPHEEAKLVRCLTGSVFDVVVDLRAGSQTLLSWLGVELNGERRNALYIPPGLAHGFLSLVDGCELEYLISAAYAPAAAVGIRWDDPAVGIAWPFGPTVVSGRDAGYPDLDVERARREGPGALR